MALIPLTQNKYAVIDDEDYHYLSRFTWQYANVNGIEIVRRGMVRAGKHSHVDLQDYIVARPIGRGLPIFKNGDRLDFRKRNLAFQAATGSTHKGKKIKTFKGKPTLSTYKGVSLTRGRNKDMPLEELKKQRKVWRAQIERGVRGTDSYVRWIKCFDTEVEAALAYNEKAKELFGKYAYQNVIKQNYD